MRARYCTEQRVPQHREQQKESQAKEAPEHRELRLLMRREPRAQGALEQRDLGLSRRMTTRAQETPQQRERRLLRQREQYR